MINVLNYFSYVMGLFTFASGILMFLNSKKSKAMKIVSILIVAFGVSFLLLQGIYLIISISLFAFVAIVSTLYCLVKASAYYEEDHISKEEMM